MATYPRDRKDFLIWAEAHVDLWIANAAQIGLSAPQSIAFKDAISTLRTKTTGQQIARDAAKSATESAVSADSDARALASDLVRSIRAFALNTNNPTVYQLSQIPAPNPSAPVAPPGQPTDFKVELNPDGSITIKWKAKHPEGSDRVVYFVQRRLITESAFRFIGGTGDRFFTDDDLPIGIDGASYIFTAQRGSVQSPPSSQLSVTFGSSGGGGGGAVRFGYSESPATGKMAA